MFSKILRDSVEENYHIQVMLVGNEGIGKSTLLRRLLGKSVKIKKYCSTNGIDVHIHSCDVDMETREWHINNTRKAGITAVAKLSRYLSGATNTQLANNSSEKIVVSTIQESEDEDNQQIATGRVADIGQKTMMSKNWDDNDEAFVTPVHPSIDFDDIDAIIRKTELLMAIKENPRARVDFYDFAGQLIFYASHPTFLSSKAIYIMTFDLSKIYSGGRTRKVDKAHVNRSSKVYHGAVSDIDSIFFWLNIVYMFALSKQNIHPHVILLGMHADMLP